MEEITSIQISCREKVALSWGLTIPMNVIQYTLPKLWKAGILTRDGKTNLYNLSDPES
jgi:hypothetical protein